MLWFRLSKKWLAPLFRGFHSSLAPTARPGSYAGKPLLRKAFCGFAVHAAKSDESLRGLRPPNPRGFFDRLGRGPKAPAHALVLRVWGALGPPRPAKRRRPPRNPTATCSPAPALARRPYGGCPGGRKDGTTMRGGRRRLAAGGPKAPRPAKQKSGARGPWPRAPLFQDASRPAAAPPAGFSTTAQKATQKPGLSVYPAPLRPPPEKRW